MRSEEGDSGEIVMEEWQFNAHSKLKEVVLSKYHYTLYFSMSYLHVHSSK